MPVPLESCISMKMLYNLGPMIAEMLSLKHQVPAESCTLRVDPVDTYSSSRLQMRVVLQSLKGEPKRCITGTVEILPYNTGPQFIQRVKDGIKSMAEEYHNTPPKITINGCPLPYNSILS